MSFRTVVALSLVLHGYIGLRLVPHLPLSGGVMLGLLLCASAVLVPLGLAARRFARPPASDRLTWVGMLCLGLFSSWFILTLVRDLGLLLASAFVDRDWRGETAAVVAMLGVATSLWGLWNARRRAPVVRVEIPIAGLPRELEGFRFAQISDIHVGPTIKKRYLDGIVDTVNGLEADVVAITGDLVDGSVPELREHVAPLSRLRAREGSFFVTGNHEYYAGVHPWLAELRRLGLRVLLNEHVVVSRGGQPLVLAGVTDFMAGHFDASHRSDPAGALRGAPEGAIKVLLAHQPRSAPAAADAGFHLQLSGHTHGGQFMPWMLFVPLQQPYIAGLHRLRQLWIYVSRGTGYWGPPKRVGAPSEITLVILRAA